MPEELYSLSFCKKIVFLFLVTVFFLFGSELVTRFYLFRRITISDNDWKYLRLQYNYAKVPYLGFEPGPSTRFYNEDIGMTVDVNSLGFRSDEIAFKKPPGTIRMVFLGGSSTYGTGITTNHKTWPYQLRKMLEEMYPDKKFEAVNASFPGYTTVENLIRFQLRVLELKPDIVFLYNVHNDLKQNNTLNFMSDYSHARNIPSKPNFIVQLFKHSVLFLKIRQRLKILSVKSSLHEKLDPEALRVYLRNVRSLVGICRIRNIKVVLITHVISYTDHSEAAKVNVISKMYWEKRKKQVRDVFHNLTIPAVEQGFKQYNQALLDLADQYEGVYAVDAAGLFPEQEKWSHMRDICHFDDVGAGIFSRIIAGEIEKLSLMKSVFSSVNF